MKNKIEDSPAITDQTSLDRWLGRREAFGLIAGRCSADDVACLREIRERKLYLKSGRNWDEFCRVELKCSRHRIDNSIRQLDEHGPQFFLACQALRLTEAEYVAIKPHIAEEGVERDGQLIRWGEENSSRLTQALQQLRAIAAPKTPRKERGFDSLLDRLHKVNQELEKSPVSPDDRQLRSLGEALRKLSFLAQRRGIVLIQR